MAPTPVEDLDPNDNNAFKIYIPVGVFGVICPALVSLRIWSRVTRGGQMGADDWTCVVALFFCLASSALMVASCHYGFGRHFRLIEEDDKVETYKYFWLCQVTYKASINLTKCSILLLYLRIFNKINWFRLTCWGLIGVIGAFATATIVATIFQCTPVEKAYHLTMDGECIDNNKFWWANAGFSIATDIVILLIPMPLVYQLKVSAIQKLALTFVFALGGFVVVTSCLRATTIDQAAQTNDLTYNLDATMWTIIEPNVAVICACLPMVRPLLVKIFPKIFSSRKTYAGQYGPSYPSRTHVTANSQVRSDKGNWMELRDGKDGGNLTTTTIQRTGSEEDILSDPHHPQHAADPLSIQKTVQYSVEYSQREI